MPDLKDLEQVTPGTWIRLEQTVRIDGGLLSSPDPEELFWTTVDNQAAEFGRLGYVVVLDWDAPADAAIPPGGLAMFSDWSEAADGEHGEPTYRFRIQWLVLEVADPDPAVLQAGFPFIWAAVVFAGVLLFGTVLVIDEAREFFVEAGDEAAEVAREATAGVAVLGVVILAVLLLTR